MAGRRVHPVRLLAASALGAGYAALCLKPGFAFLGELHWRLVSLGLMSFLAYGPEVKLGCCFTVLDLALGGAVMAADRGGLWQLPLYAAGVYLLGKFAFGTPGKRLLPVQISGSGKTLRITALLDTGNQLRDPITGEAVLVIGGPAAYRPGCGAAEKTLADHDLAPVSRAAADPLSGGGGGKRAAAGHALSGG